MLIFTNKVHIRLFESVFVSVLIHVHHYLAKTRCVCVLSMHVCEAVGEVRGCEGEGYPTASERKRKKEGGSSLACWKKKRGEMKNGR